MFGDTVAPARVRHLGVGEAVLLRIGILDIADGAGRLRDVLCNAFVAASADADGPINRRVGADFAGPIRVHFRQVVREDEGRARSVRAVNDRDRLVGKSKARVERLDGRIAPVADLADEDLRQRRAIEHELAGCNPAMFTTGTTPPITAGNWARSLASSSGPFKGLSLAPNVTVPALIC